MDILTSIPAMYMALGHIAVTVHTLLAYNCSLYPRWFTAFKVNAVLSGLTCEYFGEPEFQRLVLVVGIPVKSQLLTALPAVRRY